MIAGGSAAKRDRIPAPGATGRTPAPAVDRRQIPLHRNKRRSSPCSGDTGTRCAHVFTGACLLPRIGRRARKIQPVIMEYFRRRLRGPIQDIPWAAGMHDNHATPQFMRPWRLLLQYGIAVHSLPAGSSGASVQSRSHRQKAKVKRQKIGSFRAGPEPSRPPSWYDCREAPPVSPYIPFPCTFSPVATPPPRLRHIGIRRKRSSVRSISAEFGGIHRFRLVSCR